MPRPNAHVDELRLDAVIAVASATEPRPRARADRCRPGARPAAACRGSEDTHLGARGQAAHVHASPTDPSGSSESESVTVLASRTLPSGGTLGVSATGDRLKHCCGSARRQRKSGRGGISRYSAGVAVQLTQPLLRGAGATAFEAPIRQAARQRDAAALTREAKARDLIVSLVHAYWEVAFSWRQLEVRKASLDLAQQQLAYTESAIRSENVARSEVLAVQEAIATRKQDVIAAEQLLYDQSLALRQISGLEIGPEALVVKTEALPAKVDAPDVDMAVVVRAAFDHSAELAALEARPARGRDRGGRGRQRGEVQARSRPRGRPGRRRGDARQGAVEPRRAPGLRDHGEPDARPRDRAPHRARRPGGGSCGGLDRQGHRARRARQARRARDAGRAADEGRARQHRPRRRGRSGSPSRMSPPSRSGSSSASRPTSRCCAARTSSSKPGCAASRRSATTSSHAPTSTA